MSLLNSVLNNTINNSQNINPLQLLNELRSGKISSNTILTFLRKNNPQQVQEIEQMLKGKNQNEINALINNLCKQKGINPNELTKLLSK